MQDASSTDRWRQFREMSAEEPGQTASLTLGGQYRGLRERTSPAVDIDSAHVIHVGSNDLCRSDDVNADFC